jgi:hypothetical protein
MEEQKPTVIDVPIPGVTNKNLKVSDASLEMILNGLLIPNANAIHALAKEVKQSRERASA